MNEQEQSDNFKVMNLSDLPDRYFVVNEQKPINPGIANLFDFDSDNFPNNSNNYYRHHHHNYPHSHHQFDENYHIQQHQQQQLRRHNNLFNSHSFFVDYTSFEENNNETENDANDDEERESSGLFNRRNSGSQRVQAVGNKKTVTYDNKNLESTKFISGNNGTNKLNFNIDNKLSKYSPPILNSSDTEAQMSQKSHIQKLNNNKSVAETIDDEIKEHKTDIWTSILVGFSYVFLVIFFPFSLCSCIKICQEYERAVIFRLGRILRMGAKGPGLFFVLPCVDTYLKVDLRTVTFDVPPQEILTKDSVTVSVDAVVYFRILNAVVSVINVEDAAKSTKLLAATTLRNILGTKSLQEILSDRESVAFLIQSNLDDATEPWGVKVERVEVKDVRLPIQLQRAMATEAEATREARAKVIAAEGEQKASKALKEAAEVIRESPIAIQLRYLQTLTAIASERNSTIVFPIPIEILGLLTNKNSNST